ncbi:MAG: hypothetical protein HC822_19975 [Oscillochloris sp.]|nr:hypothetical protein [Oscillochloris sp.]
MKHKYLLISLFVLISLAVVPYGWIAEHIPAVDRVLDGLFAGEFAHAVGHTLIFFTIGTALLLAWPGLRRAPMRYMLMMFSIALIQEGLQLMFKDRGIILNDITDIATDLVAAGLALTLQQLRATPQGSDAVQPKRQPYGETARRRR